MQLFTIGLWELGPDGTRRLEHGRPVPTYTNDDIRELARVFTGLSFPRKEAEKGGFKWGHTDWTARLVAYPQFHDDGEKRLLGGRKVLPAGQGADKDIADALDLLFEHPNTGPFVARLLIQRFTTSNPSRGYVRRVAGVFADNGQGVRGDLKAVLRAVLTDAEAWTPAARADMGKQREPYLRLVAPEFEITTAVTAVSLPNFLRDCIYRGAVGRWGGNIQLDYSGELPLAGQPAALVERLNLLLAGGRMEPGTKKIIADAAAQIPADKPQERVRLAVYLASISPESAILP